MIVDIILWYAVALLCVKCLNEENADGEEWEKEKLWIKAFALTIAPVAIILFSIKKAFKK